MNKILSLILMCLCLNLGTHKIYAKRIIQSLNGEWLFCIDKQNTKHIYSKGLPNEALKVQVPHTWNVQNGLEDYIGLAWYGRSFYIPKEAKGKDLRIKFHAIYRDATVYINGKKVGEHLSSGYNAFYIDIANSVKYGYENELVVSVSNAYSDTALPYQDAFDWANDGGIIRGVDLIIADKPSIRFAHVKTENTGKVTVDVKLWQPSSLPFDCTISITERRSGKELTSVSQSLKAQEQKFSFSLTIDNPKLWHFDHPELYDIKVTTIQKGKEADTFTSHFGFREIKTEGDKLYLNGEPVRLIGVEWMPGSNPDYGMAEPHEYIDKILRDMKEANCVITRFHWQQDEYVLDKLDNMGILVQEEIPWWQQPGDHSPETRKVIEMQLTEMIEEHYNHPCIFSWGISNEVSYSTHAKPHEELVAFTRNLDDSRFTQIVSSEMQTEKENDRSLLGNIPTWNEYIGTWQGKDREEVREHFKEIKAAIGNRPMMITEHGLCEPRFTGGDAERINDMNFHIREWAKQDWIAAAIYFSLNDYRTHKGEEGNSKYKSRTHGVTGLYGERKPSFYLLKEMSSPLEILNVRKVGNSFLIILRNKNSLPSYNISGYTVETGNVTIDLPDMKPGETINVPIPADSKYFIIKRPNGYNVLKHKLR